MAGTHLVLCVLLLLAFCCSAEAVLGASRNNKFIRETAFDMAGLNQDDTEIGVQQAAHVGRSLQGAAAATTVQYASVQKQQRQQRQALPACQLPPRERTNTTFDYYTFSGMWPPSVFQFGQSFTAGQMVQQGVAADGFWVHGLWPSASQGSSVMNCGTTQLQLTDISSAILPNMTYWWPGMKVPFTQASALELWDHEWQKHGTCSGLNASAYFTSAVHQAERLLPKLTALLRSANMTPSSHTPYKLGQVLSVLDAAYGNSYIITCDNNTAGHLMLSQVEFCLSHWSMKPCGCWLLANGQRLDKKSSCGSNPEGLVWIMAFATTATYAGVQLSSAAATIIGCAFGFLLLLVLAWLVAWQCGLITPLLKPRKITVVHNPLIHEAVEVSCEPLSMEWLWSTSPGLADFVHDLPAGMAIKGGIARKVLKHKYGTPEPPGSFDIDCLVLLPDKAFTPGVVSDKPGSSLPACLGDGPHSSTAAAESPARAAHDAVTGMQLGALRLEAQDVEVISKSHLRDYFVSRDTTMNEALILNDGRQPVLFYTAAAKADVEADLVRPSCHLKASELQVYWEVDEATGAPYIAPNVVCRCIIRYLKGHGSDYAFDAGTWAHYRHHKLDKPTLFKVLRAFHTDSIKLQAAVDHLVDIGFLKRLDVWRAGGANKLWGLLLQEVNNSIAKHGGRLQLGQLDPEGVEKWITTKKAQTASKHLFSSLRARRTGWLASNESTEELGKLQLPAELEAYIATGPVFDYCTYAHTKTIKVQEVLAGATSNAAAQQQHVVTPMDHRSPHVQQQHHHHNSTIPAASASVASRSQSQAAELSEVLTSRRQAWSSFIRAASLAGPHEQAVQTVLQQYGSDVLQQYSPVRGAHGGTDQSAHQQKAHVAYATAGSTVGRDAGAPAIADAAPLTIVALRRSRSAALRSLQTAEQMHQQQQQQASAPVLATATRAADTCLVAKSAGSAADADSSAATGGGGGGGGGGKGSAAATDAVSSSPTSVWQRFSEVGAYKHSSSHNQLGSFYQVLDTEGHSFMRNEQQRASIITDAERQGRRCRPTKQLLAFLFSTMKDDAWLYLLACSLIFAGAACQLMLPWIEGQIFDFLSPWQAQQFYQMVGYMGALTAAYLVLQLCGTLVLELAARRVMARLFLRLFNHLLAQNPDFFNSISKGELMSRLSGDSLALRGMISSSLVNIAQGVLTTIATVGVLQWIWSATPYYGDNYFDMVLFVGLGVSLVEAVAAAATARPLTLKSRQATGRMFGFLLDIMSHTGAICALGIEGMIAHSYTAYVSDVFRSTFHLNAFKDVHRMFSMSVQNVVTLLFVYFGGQEVIAGLTSIGTLVATLRYIRMQQRGVKQAADSFVRFTAALGNLERLLDLHDRGTLSVLPEESHSSSNRPSGPQADLQGAHEKPDPPHQADQATSKDYNVTTTASRGAVTGSGAVQRAAAVPSSIMLLSDSPPAVKAAAAKPTQAFISALRLQVELFGRMTGGLKLCGVSVMVPGRAGRGAIIQGLDLQVLPGTAALVIGTAGEPLAPLLETAALLNVPYEGQVLLQLAGPQHTSQQQHEADIQASGHTAIDIDQQTVAGDMQEKNCGVVANLAARNSRSRQQLSLKQQDDHAYDCAATTKLPWQTQLQQERQFAAGSAVRTELPKDWHAVQHLRDYLPAARGNIALVTAATGAVFRGSVEDNVACAAAAAAGDVCLAGAAAVDAAGLTHSSIADVCSRVGLTDEVMLLPDGFRTVIGEGTGFTLSSKATLQLALARCLLKRPKLLLLGDVLLLETAVRRQRLLQLLQQQLDAGCAVVMTAVVEEGGQSLLSDRSRGAADVYSLAQALECQVQTYLMTDSRLVAIT